MIALLTRSLLVLVILSVASCHSQRPFREYSPLFNQGILPLSNSNAYLGANLFIASEAQASRQLFMFLSGRGGPTAIELSENEAGRQHLLLFYPREKEVYAAELVEFRKSDDSPHREWVVRGPYGIERKDYAELARLESSFVGEPLFMIGGRPRRFKEAPAEETEVKTVLVPVLPTPKPTPRPTIVVRPKPSPEDQLASRPANSDQQAIFMAKGYAERAENGDLVHTVRKADESLAKIAEWYTGSRESEKTIAEENGLAAGGNLTPGQRIRVPASLVKIGKQMP